MRFIVRAIVASTVAYATVRGIQHLEANYRRGELKVPDFLKKK